MTTYVSRVLYPYSAFYRPRFDRVGLGPRGVRSPDDLRRLPLTRRSEVVDPTELVLRPDEPSIQRHGSASLLMKVSVAKVRASQSHFNQRVIDPTFKPIHWHVDDGMLVGSSAEDVERLAELGRRWLELAGVRRYDVVVGLLPAGPNLAYWELVLGCRRAGLAAIHLGPTASPAQLDALRPAALVGRPADLVRVLEDAAARGVDLGSVRTVLTAGEPPDEPSRTRLRALLTAPDAAVLGAFAPPLVRAMWAECRASDGFHTWPDCEVIDVVDASSGLYVPGSVEGEVVWTALGWKGTVAVRLRTGVVARLDERPCPGCGTAVPRLHVVQPEAGLAGVLESHPAVAAWQAEWRSVDGHDELLVFLAPVAGVGHPGRLVRELDAQLLVSQFVVLSRPEVDARLAAAGGRRVLDLRA